MGADKFVKGEKSRFSQSPTKMSFYKFNQLTGRIAASAQRLAYSPTGLQAKLVESAPAEFSSASVVAAPVAEPVLSSAGEVATFENSRGMHPTAAAYKQKILDTQAEWAKTPHLYVWQKRGNVDMVPYYITYGMCFVGMAYIMKGIYEMSFPAKKQ